jgi:hypothetical protein
MDNADDVARDDSDDELEFTNDEDDFLMMALVVTMSQKIAAESVASKVSFMWSMLSMVGDRLRNVPKNCQFRSPFDSKGRHPNVPLTKALALMKKCKKDSWLHKYDYEILQNQLLIVFCSLNHNTSRHKRLHACYNCITTIIYLG